MCSRLYEVALPFVQHDDVTEEAIAEYIRLYEASNHPGDVGPYERLDGTVYIELDPRNPLNAVVVNLDKAPKTPKGMVGFSSPFFVLKPVDMARGNRKIFYGDSQADLGESEQ